MEWFQMLLCLYNPILAIHVFPWNYLLAILQHDQNIFYQVPIWNLHWKGENQSSQKIRSQYFDDNQSKIIWGMPWGFISGKYLIIIYDRNIFLISNSIDNIICLIKKIHSAIFDYKRLPFYEVKCQFSHRYVWRKVNVQPPPWADL